MPATVGRPQLVSFCGNSQQKVENDEKMALNRRTSVTLTILNPIDIRSVRQLQEISERWVAIGEKYVTNYIERWAAPTAGNAAGQRRLRATPPAGNAVCGLRRLRTRPPAGHAACGKRRLEQRPLQAMPPAGAPRAQRPLQATPPAGNATSGQRRQRVTQPKGKAAFG
jgi:hypothetical protein